MVDQIDTVKLRLADQVLINAAVMAVSTVTFPCKRFNTAIDLARQVLPSCSHHHGFMGPLISGMNQMVAAHDRILDQSEAHARARILVQAALVSVSEWRMGLAYDAFCEQQRKAG